MDLSNDNQKKVLIIVATFIVAFAMMFVGVPMLTNKIADKVIEKLSAGYTPGPYAPGIDPDKIDINKLNGGNVNVDWQN